MKKHLISPEGQFYKANLHCHTTVSDGRMTPQEVKDYYMARGYSVIAFTDHCVLLPHPELNEENFLALNGYENEFISKDELPVNRRKHGHFCFIALKKDNVTMPYCALKSIWGNAKNYIPQVKFDHDHTLEDWRYDPELINQVIHLAREAGFFVTYNHPVWSVEHYADYSRYTGMNAMEIANYGSLVAGFPDYVPHVYDELLLKGERIFAIATDDNHSAANSCGAWTMIKAPKLEYEAVTSALEKGDFYSSLGPQIHALWFEDGRVHIRCSEAKRVMCTYGTHRAVFARSQEGTPVTEASFEVVPSDLFFRITVVDEDGNCADTNAYFADTLFEE